MGSDYLVRAGGDGDMVSQSLDAIAGFNDMLDEDLMDAIHEATKATRTHLRGNSPKMTGDYAKDFACDFMDRDGHHEGVVKNQHHYQLTHLLEDGHNSHNQYNKGGPPYGTVPPAKPEHHMEKAMDHGKRVLEQRLGARL